MSGSDQTAGPKTPRVRAGRAESLRLSRQSARDALGPITYPAELPICQRRDDIADAIRDHQVVIVAGETGSGKTTQLPKICLDLGRGIQAMIGHTQPRRIAARSVAERIAHELGTPLGEAVGYQVRFTGHTSESTVVKVMTDGILLAQTQRDRLLRAYDTIIVDEAHERSLNIDFILGYLHYLLPRRPDLKLIITSATIDPHSFSRHFNNAPVIEVSGRMYPVEVRYQPIVDEPSELDQGELGSGEAAAESAPRDQIQAICDAVAQLCAEGPGDILVFLSGEREIRDSADALRGLNLPGPDAELDILPLYARLSTAEQQRVFEPHPTRRVVLATNVAETSLTVPGIRYVVDPGTARISRYSQRLKVQRLPIEPISQASANQRAGRCGRTSDGICIRLYSETEFADRPAFTDPEILRTNLASVILQMAALDLGDIESFGFLEPPDRRAVNDGVNVLHELGAFASAARAGRDGRRRLTPLGARLAQLPVDPRLGRMILAAAENKSVREVLIIVSALSIQDPRERPLEHREAAAAKHGRFRDPESDFLTLLNLWGYLAEQQAQLSSNQFRRLCKADFLNYLRVREWQDLDGQLRQIVRGMGISLNREPASPTKIHLSLLAGLLSHLGLREVAKPEYIGARGARFWIAPGSALFRKNARWVMAAELVETSRVWARVVTRVEPEWAERLAAHLVKRSYSEPHWSADQHSVMAMEKVTLYGLPLVASRRVHYGRIDPVLSRELFIRHALVEGDWSTRHRFFHDNRALLADVEELEHRARRRDILVDDQSLFDFYDERIPADVVSGRHFDSWWKSIKSSQPDLLSFEKAMLIQQRAEGVDRRDYPDQWRQGELSLRLTYQFEPGTDKDGVSVHIPLPALPQVAPAGFDWQIPGLRPDLVTALLRSLPKSVRRHVVPIPEVARDFLDSTHGITDPNSRADGAPGPLVDALAAYLDERVGVQVGRDDWQLDRIPAHLRVTFEVDDDSGHSLASGKDLLELKRRLAPQSREVLAEAADDVERAGLTAWNPGTLARVIQRRRSGYAVTGYPALVDEVDSVAVRVFETEAEQHRAMLAGTRRLLLLELPTPIPLLSRRLSTSVKLGLTRYPYGRVPDLLDDCVNAAIDALVARSGGPAWDDEGYARLRESVRAELTDATVEVVVAVEQVVAAAHEIRTLLSGRLAANAPDVSIADLRSQLLGLVGPGFVTETGWQRLADLPRYLRGMRLRLDRLAANPGRDRDWTATVAEVRAEYRDLLAGLPPGRRESEDVQAIRWMLEELRISLFAQELRTPYPISAVRIFRAIDAISTT